MLRGLKNIMANKNQKLHFEDEKTQEKQYFKELIGTIFEEEKKGKKWDKTSIQKLKNRLAAQYSLVKPPRDMDIFLNVDRKDLDRLKYLRAKPTRSLSGVAVIAIMTRPDVCPHGKCTFCPGGLDSPFGDTPQSYTGFEPATRRGFRNDFDSFLQVFNRLEQYTLSGHEPNKCDVIVMGGTFPSYDVNYQTEFIQGIYLAMNKFSELFYEIIDGKPELNYVKFKEWFELPHDMRDNSIGDRLKEKMRKLKAESLAEIPEGDKLEYLKKINETCAIRCIGLTQETKPDWGLLDHANRMLYHGTTRIELGIQTVYNDVLRKTARGHTITHSKKSTQILKDLGFKINYHMMTGLPGVDKEKDLKSLQEIFNNQEYRPDMIKIYPCLVLPGTLLYDQWKEGKFKPQDLMEAAEVIGEFLDEVPAYVKVMRIQRDIPSTLVEGGVQKTNLRQYVDDYMKEHGLKSKEIRVREVIRNTKKLNPDNIEIRVFEYEASGGKEYFISAEDFENNILIGFCRLRFIKEALREEFTENSAIIRELHVYGAALNLSEKRDYSQSSQHKGWGKKLLAKAEEIAKEAGKDKMLVISGVGVREYYRNLGYENDGLYVSKKL